MSLLIRCLLASLLTLAQAAVARDLLAVGTHFPRVLELTEAGKPVGMSVDLLTQAAASQGHQIRFELYPWLRAQAMVEQGHADILIGPYRTPERELRFLFSQLAFYEDPLIFYVRRAQPGAAAAWHGDFAALGQLPIGLVQGWAYGDALEAARARLRIHNALNVETGLLMLKAGRVDLLASNERNTTPVIEQLGLQNEVQSLQPPLSVLRGHFAYPRSPAGEQLRVELDRALAALRAAGEIRELSRRWKVRSPE